MANAIYPKYKEALLSGANNIALDDGSLRVSLVDQEEILYSSTDQYYANLDANGVIATANLLSVTVTDGVLDAADVVLANVSGDEIESLLFWIDTTDANTSRLVCWIDANVTGLPYTPDGSNVQITWNATGIFKL